MTPTDIYQHIQTEFGAIADKFAVHDLALAAIPTDKTAGAAKPGVYVFLRGGQPIKVGRSTQNSRKRAYEHIGSNTGGTMGALTSDESVRVVLFNVADDADLHWVCALEVFLERKLTPVIRSARLC